ncbi:MAG: Crp/Fnr family transcriptional regulator [Oscillospiraceae bacterium]|nr:Crp/Fnr family transcriptional regulator [Oscillospiraceae bacterium]
MTNAQEKIISHALRMPLFSGISETEIKKLLSEMGGKVVVCPEGQTLTVSGSHGSKKNLYMLISGIVQLVRYGEQGVCYLIDYTVPGGIIDHTDIRDIRFQNGVYVAGKDCVLLRMTLPEPRKDSSEALSKFERNLMNAAADRNARLVQKVDIISRRTVREKLLTFLRYESRRQRSSSFEIPLNRQELADYICVDRTTLSTELGRLKNEGIIHNSRNYFELIG